jgi:hypothetical protein
LTNLKQELPVAAMFVNGSKDHDVTGGNTDCFRLPFSVHEDIMARF